MPSLTLPTLTDRALAALPSEHRAKFDPITLAILSALIGEVCVRLVDECWDRLHPRTIRAPWAMGRRQLRHLVTRCTDSLRVQAACHGSAWTAEDVDRELGDDAQAAALGLGKTMTDGEIEGIRAKGIQ